jgi:Putative peptidoglycan binding domain
VPSADERLGLFGRFPTRDSTCTVDGYYGPHTYSTVRFVQGQIDIHVDGITGPQTWGALCDITGNVGYQGAYWYDAGCPSIYY